MEMWRILRPDARSVTEDKMARKSLGRYFSVMKNEKAAKFMIARRLPANFTEQDGLNTLWQKHAALTQKFYQFEKTADGDEAYFRNAPTPEKSYFDLKIEIANRILRSCHLCRRRCAVNRLDGQLGYCKCGTVMKVSSIFEHMGEEPELVPSGTIFTMGCTIQCRHCQNWTISQWEEAGVTYGQGELAKKVEQLRLNGCRNINLVGGEPTPWLPQWLNVFKLVEVNVPIVWNSNTYYSPEAARLLAGFADIYLLDFKYGPEKCAEKISDAPSYWETCTYDHLEAKKFGETIIRMLILPGHFDCCTKPIINWIAANLGIATRVNIMFQYRPEWRAFEIPELQRGLTKFDMDKTLQLARASGLQNFIT